MKGRAYKPSLINFGIQFGFRCRGYDLCVVLSGVYEYYVDIFGINIYRSNDEIK